MLRKALIVVLMAPLLVAAMASGTSFPILLLMVCLLLIALGLSTARDEQ